MPKVFLQRRLIPLHTLYGVGMHSACEFAEFFYFLVKNRRRCIKKPHFAERLLKQWQATGRVSCLSDEPYLLVAVFTHHALVNRIHHEIHVFQRDGP
jgi:hypothetical protein